MSLIIEGPLAQRRLSARMARSVDASRTVQRDFDHLTSDDETYHGTPCDAHAVSTLPLQQWRAIPDSQFNFTKEIVAVGHSASSAKGHALFTSSAPTHLLHSRNTINDSESSRFGTDFVLRQRFLIARGWPVDMVMGVDIVETSGIFTDEYQIAQPATISQWVALVASRFDSLGVPERLGLMLLCGRYLRVWS